MQPRLVITLAEQEGRLVPALDLPRPPAIGALLIGEGPERAVDLLGRLFNLCRHAQEAAARLALGLPAAEAAPLRAEILRDSLFRLFIALPRSMGRAPLALPQGWQADPRRLLPAVFGRSGGMPDGARAFHRWLSGAEGLAPLLVALTRLFAPGEAAARRLPFGVDGPCENSAAARHAGHPVMTAVEAEAGRGPVWRTIARMLDIVACLEGRLPSARLVMPGVAEAPATRGLYRIGVTLTEGRVSAVRRRTPTDDICHPDGALLSALAALPATKRHLAPVVVECFDPCLPWHLQEAAHA